MNAVSLADRVQRAQWAHVPACPVCSPVRGTGVCSTGAALKRLHRLAARMLATRMGAA